MRSKLDRGSPLDYLVTRCLPPQLDDLTAIG